MRSWLKLSSECELLTHRTSHVARGSLKFILIEMMKIFPAMISFLTIVSQVYAYSLYRNCDKLSLGSLYCLGIRDNKAFFDSDDTGCIQQRNCQVMIRVEVAENSHLRWRIASVPSNKSEGTSLWLAIHKSPIEIVIIETKNGKRRRFTQFIPFIAIFMKGSRQMVKQKYFNGAFLQTVDDRHHLLKYSGEVIKRTDDLSQQKFEIFKFASNTNGVMKMRNSSVIIKWAIDFMNDPLYFSVVHTQPSDKKDKQKYILLNIGHDNRPVKVFSERPWDVKRVTSESPLTSTTFKKSTTTDKNEKKKEKKTKVLMWVGISVILVVLSTVFIILCACFIKTVKPKKTDSGGKSETRSDEPIILYKRDPELNDTKSF